tara:strand:+ start:1017 stop:1544 length:528 start_codon:yes stop_codon:yes gene_type:complete
MNKKLKLEELNRLSIEDYKKLNKHRIVVVLDNIRSLHNVGSFFRTCDAFAVEKIILSGITACPPHKEIQKTALGATDSVDWKYEEDCTSSIEKYRELGYKIFAVEQTNKSKALSSIEYANEPIVLIFGNEVQGVNQQIINCCDESIEIPQFGTKHSFNVSVSCGIVLWALINQIT